MPEMWERNGKDGCRFNGGLSICGRKFFAERSGKAERRPQKEIAQNSWWFREKSLPLHPKGCEAAHARPSMQVSWLSLNRSIAP